MGDKDYRIEAFIKIMYRWVLKNGYMISSVPTCNHNEYFITIYPIDDEAGFTMRSFWIRPGEVEIAV